MTLRLYADRKNIPLQRTSVRLHHGKIYATDCAECETREGMLDRIERVITLEGDLTAEQRARLMEIADKCPVHRTLKSEIDIRTVEAKYPGLMQGAIGVRPGGCHEASGICVR
jgi:putative redox protein